MLAGSTSTATADALLWHVGNRYGLALSHRTLEMGRNLDEAIAILATAAQKSGWGKITIINNMITDETMEVLFENCAFCEGVTGENNPSCHFLAGILTGIAEGLFGEDFTAREIECRAVRGNICKFFVAKI